MEGAPMKQKKVFLIIIVLIALWTLNATRPWLLFSSDESFKIILGKILTLVFFLLWLVIVFKNSKAIEKRPKENLEEEQIPQDISPSVLKFLLDRTLLTSTDLLANLFYLIRMDACSLVYENGRLLLKKDFLLQQKNLQKHDFLLLEWLFKNYGDGERLSFSDISPKIKDKESAVIFKKNFEGWKYTAQQAANQEGYYQKSVKKGCLVPLGFGFLYFLLGMVIGQTTGFYDAAILSVLGLIGFFYFLTRPLRTEYGHQQLALWQGWQKNLETSFPKKDRFAYDEDHLSLNFIYSITLNFHEKLIKKYDKLLEDPYQVQELRDTNFIKVLYDYGRHHQEKAPFSYGFRTLKSYLDQAFENTHTILKPYENKSDHPH